MIARDGRWSDDYSSSYKLIRVIEYMAWAFTCTSMKQKGEEAANPQSYPMLPSARTSVLTDTTRLSDPAPLSSPSEVSG